ncbi:hypothetical protein GCM10028775_31110 [Catellatospora paridis]
MNSSPGPVVTVATRSVSVKWTVTDPVRLPAATDEGNVDIRTVLGGDAAHCVMTGTAVKLL